jgi:hypothetical protein
MRSARFLAPCLALVAASACTIVTTPPAEPPPAEQRGTSTAASLGIPPGHLPPVGQCRVWVPGRPPGHQAAARSCSGIERTASAGTWILYRPSSDKKVVHVRVVDSRRPGVIVHVRVYDAQKGNYLRDISA